MSENREQRDSGLALHRALQWIATIGVTVLSALVISGMGTWDQFKVFMYRMEDVPTDIKEMKEDLSDVKNETMSLKWRVTNLETPTKRK